MARLLFEKTGNAVWISHLDLMRLFQRAFKRAALPLTHTQGFNPRPSVSIALPLSVGIESQCELLDFQLDGDSRISSQQIKERLNDCLIEGVRVLDVYEDGRRIRDLSLLNCHLQLQYDDRIPDSAEDAIKALFSRDELIVEKKTKSGLQDQNIIPLIHKMSISSYNNSIRMDVVISCQNPSLNPIQLVLAINKYIPRCTPDAYFCRRIEVFDKNQDVFR